MHIFLSISLIVLLLGSVGVAPLYTMIPSAWAAGSGSGENDTKFVVNQVATPLQHQIQDVTNRQMKEGRPHPVTTFESAIIQNGTAGVKASTSELSANVTTIKARTTLEFDGPAEAGKARWDDFIIRANGTLPLNSTVLEGNYTQLIVDKYPQIYAADRSEYGHEKRKYVIEETIIISDPEPRSIEATAGAHSILSTSSDVVMGFTQSSTFNYDRSVTAYACFFFCFPIATASLHFSAMGDLGLRLPARVIINAPDIMTVGGNYDFNTSLTPLDFGPDDYQRLGVPIEDGNEFVAKLALSIRANLDIIFVRVINIDKSYQIDLTDLCILLASIECGNFVTPFGVDENGVERVFPIPHLDIPPKIGNTIITGLIFPFDLFGVPAIISVNLRLTPNIGSDKISADWFAAGGASGSDSVIYTAASPAQFTFGPIKAVDNGTAFVTLDNYRYYFTRILLTLSANLQGDLLGFTINSDYFKLYDFNLGAILNLGEPSLGQHPGTPGVVTQVLVVNPPGINQTMNLAATSNVTKFFNGTFLITHSYTVLNTGTHSITNISVIDNSCSPVTSFSGGPIVPPENSMLLSCSTTANPPGGFSIIAGTATASADVCKDLACTIIAGSAPIATANSTVVVGGLNTSLTVTANTTSGIVPFGVHYDYEAINHGILPITNVQVKDDSCFPIVPVNTNPILAPSDTMTFSCDGTVTSNITSSVTATGTICLNPDCTELDGIVDIGSAQTAITALTAQLSLKISQSPAPDKHQVTLTYVVTNVGSVPITDITIKNDNCSPVELFSGGPVLAHGSSMTFSCTRALTVSFIDTANASGTVCLNPDCTIKGGPAPIVTASSAASFNTVGGEILSTDATSLFVAGVFANASWIVPMAGVAAVGIVGFAIRKRIR